MSANSGLRLVTTSLASVQATVTAPLAALATYRNDRFYLGLLGAWVVFLAAVAYLLLG